MDLHRLRGRADECRWQIICNGSPNGLFVNRRRVSKQSLTHGDLIGFAHGHNTKIGEELEGAAFVYEFLFEEISSSRTEDYQVALGYLFYFH